MAEKAARPKTYEELGVRLFAPAPEGFEPVGASDDELLVHGYPGRPDAQLHPRLHEHWQRVVSKSISKIQPKFGIGQFTRPTIGPIATPPIGPIATPPIGPIATPPVEPPTRGFSANWAGSVAYPSEFPVTTVSAGWTVPTVTDPATGSALPVCATWTGIDGWKEENALVADLLQVGTTQLVGSAFAWWQWLPDCAVPITNLAVSPGDVIYCTIRALSETEAAIYLVNETTAVAVLFATQALTKTRLLGATAEWIVELPQAVDGQPVELGNFRSVFFDHCVAYGQTGPILYPGAGELLTMVDRGYQLAVPNVLADDSIRIDFVGPPRL